MGLLPTDGVGETVAEPEWRNREVAVSSHKKRREQLYHKNVNQRPEFRQLIHLHSTAIDSYHRSDRRQLKMLKLRQVFNAQNVSKVARLAGNKQVARTVRICYFCVITSCNPLIMNLSLILTLVLFDRQEQHWSRVSFWIFPIQVT